MNDLPWYTSEVVTGNKLGKTLGYPTLNLKDPRILSSVEKGVYAAQVKYGNKIYQGALYYGPRSLLGEVQDVIEIFLLQFDKNLYGETISFQLLKFIRTPIHFTDFDQLKQQLEKDVTDVKTAFQPAQ